MKKSKKILVVIMALVLSICMLTGCNKKLNDEEEKEVVKLNREEVKEVAEMYLGDIVNKNFKIISATSYGTTPANKEDFYAQVTSNILDPITDIPADTIPSLEEYIHYRLDKFYEEVSYEITEININNNKATVEFVLEGPTLGYLSDTHIAYDVVLENNYYEMDEYYAWAFMDAFNLVVGDGISKSKARGTLTIEYVEENIEVTYAESKYED